MRIIVHFVVAVICVGCVSSVHGQARKNRPYRLGGVDLKQRIIWSAECRRPEGNGLAFGGQDQDAVDGRPHTRVLVNGDWKPIHKQLRAANPLQKHHARTWTLRKRAKDIRARARFIYFKGQSADEQAKHLQKKVTPLWESSRLSAPELSRKNCFSAPVRILSRSGSSGRDSPT